MRLYLLLSPLTLCGCLETEPLTITPIVARDYSSGQLVTIVTDDNKPGFRDSYGPPPEAPEHYKAKPRG